MSIKIDSPRSPAPVSRPQAESASTRAPAQGPSPKGGDSVQLTGEGLLAQELGRTLAAAPAVDAQRVAETRAAIDENRYEVDAPRIASKLLRLEWELHSA